MSDVIYTVDEISRMVQPVAMKHGLNRVYLFGSYAKGSATPASDIDLCVDTAKLKGFFALGGLYADLEEVLQKKLDLITLNSLRYNDDKDFLENLRKEMQLIYEYAQ